MYINNFFIVDICYQLVNKTRNLLFAIQLLIYIICGDRTIIGFLDNLLNRPTYGATVSVRKIVPFSSACEYVKLPFLLRMPKK
jgi:hypothetical protein